MSGETSRQTMGRIDVEAEVLIGPWPEMDAQWRHEDRMRFLDEIYAESDQDIADRRAMIARMNRLREQAPEAKGKKASAGSLWWWLLPLGVAAALGWCLSGILG